MDYTHNERHNTSRNVGPAHHPCVCQMSAGSCRHREEVH